MVRKSKKRSRKNRILKRGIIFMFMLLFLYSVSVIMYERESKGIFLEELVARDLSVTTFLPSLLSTDLFINFLIGFVSGIVSTISLIISIFFGGIGFIYVSLDPSNLNLIGNSTFQKIFFPVLIGGIFGFIIMLVVEKQLQRHFSEKAMGKSNKKELNKKKK